MIPRNLRLPGRFWFWKVTKKSGIPSWLVGRISKPIPGTKDVYSHVGIQDDTPDYLIHSRPPCVMQERIDADFWERYKNCELQLWKLKTENEKLTIKGETRLRREWVVRFFWRNNFLYDKEHKLIKKYNKSGELTGRPYDFKAIVTLGATHGNKNKVHCAEAVGVACFQTGILLTPEGAYDNTISPNNLISSGELERVI